MKNKVSYILYFTVLFLLPFGKVYAQGTPSGPDPALLNFPPPPGTPVIARPSSPLNIPEIDTYVTNCFDLYDQTNYIETQLNAIDNQLIVNKLSEMETEKIETQITGFKTQLFGLRGSGEALAASGAGMADSVTKSLRDKPLKIPAAYTRVKNGTKAVKVSVQNINTMLTVTLVDIERRLNTKGVADTATTKKMRPDSAMKSVAVTNTAKTMKTAISITGISFSAFNSFTDEIKGVSSVKSIEKKFNASGKSSINIVHYGTTDDLLNALLSNCKDVFSDKNIGGSQKGEIKLAF